MSSLEIKESKAMGILCFFFFFLSLIFSPFPLLFFLLLNDFTTTKNLVWRGVCVHICYDF